MFFSGFSSDLVLTCFRPVLDLHQTNVLSPAAMSKEGLKSIGGAGGLNHPIPPMCLRFICSLRGPRGDIN